jgi:hypothetical protein
LSESDGWFPGTVVNPVQRDSREAAPTAAQTTPSRDQEDPVRVDRREFQFIDASSNKFWAIALDGASFRGHSPGLTLPL